MSEAARVRRATPIVNAMTVDVEDYFQVSAFDRVVGAARWDRFESRVSDNTARLLDILEAAGVRATFFVLGWIAERFPDLVQRIAARGHEVASHGYGHRLVYELDASEFREDLRRARSALERAAGVPVRGYRAPSYSITRRSLWALDVLIEEGYVYDSSIFPVYHDRYGIPDAPRHAHPITRQGGSLWEIPPSTLRWAGVNLPVGGGAYLRILPYAWTKWGIGRINRAEGKPAMVYVHPWEIDPAQPRIPTDPAGRFRHYWNLHKTEARLRRLLSEFQFSTISDALAISAPAVGSRLAGLVASPAL